MRHAHLVLRLSFAIALGAPALAGVGSFDLLAYQHTGTFVLPSPDADEASAIAWNWDNDHLYVLGDEGDAIVEVTRAGVHVSTMTLTGFDDTEGLTYIGGGEFVLDEERLQDVYRVTYTAGASVSRGSLASASLGPTIGNIGIEGVAFERSTGKYFAVKEKTPQAVYEATVDFGASSASVVDLFIPNLGVADLSDIAVLSNVPGLMGTTDEGNLIILSQESQRLLEVSRTGVILSQFDLSGLSDSIEGVTIAGDGTIYLCDESPTVYVLTQVPTPGAGALLGIGALLSSRRRR